MLYTLYSIYCVVYCVSYICIYIHVCVCALCVCVDQDGLRHLWKADRNFPLNLTSLIAWKGGLKEIFFRELGRDALNYRKLNLAMVYSFSMFLQDLLAMSDVEHTSNVMHMLIRTRHASNLAIATVITHVSGRCDAQ